MTDRRDDHDDRANREAAAWLVKQDAGLSADEQSAFMRWLASDPRHDEWYRRHQDTWRRFDALPVAAPASGLLPFSAPAKPVFWRRREVWLAVAACLALGCGLWIARTSMSTEAAAVAQRSPTAAAPIRYERQVLADGTIVELHGGADVEIRYTARERRVLLHGHEASFTVASDAARPFIVEAGGVSIRAVGTAFNVQVAVNQVEVLVTEGRVQLAALAPVGADPERAHFLASGQKAVMRIGGAADLRVDRATPADLARLAAWQPQLLDFSSAPLATVIAELNRLNRTQIVLTDRSLAQVPIVASIRSDNLDGFLNILAAAGLRAERRSDHEIVLVPGDRAD